MLLPSQTAHHNAATEADLSPFAKTVPVDLMQASTVTLTPGQNNGTSNTYSDHLAIVFGIAATLLAALSILIGYMQFRLCKKLHSLQQHDIAMQVAGTSAPPINDVTPRGHPVETASCAATLCGESVAQGVRDEDAAAGVD